MGNYDVETAIEQLEVVLNENYSKAKRIMSLRNRKTDKLDKILGVIDQTYKNLLGAMALAS